MTRYVAGPSPAADYWRGGGRYCEVSDDERSYRYFDGITIFDWHLLGRHLATLIAEGLWQLDLDAQQLKVLEGL